MPLTYCLCIDVAFFSIRGRVRGKMFCWADAIVNVIKKAVIQGRLTINQELLYE